LLGERQRRKRHSGERGERRDRLREKRERRERQRRKALVVGSGRLSSGAHAGRLSQHGQRIQ